jgi:hypothetical protein
MFSYKDDSSRPSLVNANRRFLDAVLPAYNPFDHAAAEGTAKACHVKDMNDGAPPLDLECLKRFRSE